MQLSRSALAAFAQKVSSEPQPCKRCSARLRREESRNVIKVYHGKTQTMPKCSAQPLIKLVCDVHFASVLLQRMSLGSEEALGLF